MVSGNSSGFFETVSVRSCSRWFSSTMGNNALEIVVGEAKGDAAGVDTWAARAASARAAFCSLKSACLWASTCVMKTQPNIPILIVFIMFANSFAVACGIEAITYLNISECGKFVLMTNFDGWMDGWMNLCDVMSLQWMNICQDNIFM